VPHTYTHLHWFEEWSSIGRFRASHIEEEGQETVTGRAAVAARVWESVQAMEGQGRATDRAATAGRAWESVQAMKDQGKLWSVGPLCWHRLVKDFPT
jgi:hypothetical protein